MQPINCGRFVIKFRRRHIACAVRLVPPGFYAMMGHNHMNRVPHTMTWLRLLFLITAMTAMSGYRFRCYFACTDQTSTQNDYVEQRDHCREYAQLKVDMAMRESGMGMDDRNRKSQLVSLFSQCMGNNGWTVPDGKGEGATRKADAPPPAANAIASQAATAAPPAAAAHSEEKANITRASECAFARYSAAVSSNAATRAQACDLECEQALRAAPGAPRPASCPADTSERLAKGSEK